jgi:endogenous inhibitor of DNA gyrase (YacG/DUF329 family)
MVGWMVAGFPLLVLAVTVHPAFLLAIFALMFFVVLLHARIRCPRCGFHVMWRNISGPLGLRDWPPAICPQCGLSSKQEWLNVARSH